MTTRTAEAEKPEIDTGAAFRIFGSGLNLKQLSEDLGLNPDHQHRQGELDPGKKPYAHDMWSLMSPLGRNQELELHLMWLANRLLDKKDYLRTLTRQFNVDIYCWKNCYAEQDSLVISCEALRIFTELRLKFQVSLLCLSPPTARDQLPTGGAHV
jgi:hypothetical protein